MRCNETHDVLYDSVKKLINYLFFIKFINWARLADAHALCWAPGLRPWTSGGDEGVVHYGPCSL
jgi:hypothetical protein